MPNEKIVANIVNIYRYRFCILLSKFRQADRRLDKNLLSIIKLDFGEIEILLSNLQQKIIREKPALKKYLEVSCLIILLEMTLIALSDFCDLVLLNIYLARIILQIMPRKILCIHL